MKKTQMTNTVLAASGFLLPANKYYTPITDSTTQLDSLLSRSSDSSTVAHMEFLKQNNVHTSHMVNEALRSFIDDKSAQNYFNMVLIAHDILSDISLKSFLHLQTSNIFLTNTGFNFCTDIANMSTIEKNLIHYANLPYNLRFNYDGEKRIHIYQREVKLREALKNDFSVFYSTEEFLSFITANKLLFPIFFRFMFADAY